MLSKFFPDLAYRVDPLALLLWSYTTGITISELEIFNPFHTIFERTYSAIMGLWHHHIPSNPGKRDKFSSGYVRLFGNYPDGKFGPEEE